MVDFNNLDFDDSVPYSPNYTFSDSLNLKERSQANRKYQKSKSKLNKSPTYGKVNRSGTHLAYLDDPEARFKILDIEIQKP